MADNKIIQSHCNKCGQSTKHAVIATKENRDTEEVPIGNGDSFELSWGVIYSMLECCGCGDIALKKCYMDF